MKHYHLSYSQKIPTPIRDLWTFFSSPHNLERITPPQLGFNVLSHSKDDYRMYPGMLIRYTVSPLLGIKMNWLTEITQVNEPHYFIDEQRSGPYSIWHHEHHFEEIEGGVLMKDLLTYAIGYGPMDGLINRMIVNKKVTEIFAYRERKIEELFGKWNKGQG
jgi:ligand-binding SRPBCC domain-containing protein